MTLTLDIEPALRSARIREAAALAAGDVVSPLFLSGIAGFDPATLSLTLHRDASMARKVAEVQAGSFSPVPGHPSLARAELRLDATEMEDWFLAAAGQESLSADMSDDAAEDAVRADGWLVVADASRTWAACRIPVVLRDFVGRGTLSGDSVSAVAAAAAIAAVEGALSGKADLVGGVVPSSQLPEGPAPSVVFAASLAEFPAEGAAGTLYVDTGARRIYVWDGTSYAEASPSAVTSVNGATGDVSVPLQVQADWSEDSESSPSFIRNRPDLSALSGPRADWNETDSSSPRYIANKPDLGALARTAQADWTEESEGSPAYIAHKPSAEELQADWNESDDTKPSYVRGKPTAAQLQADWAETDPASPKFVDHKPDGTAWQADWLEESAGSPNHIRNRPSAVDLQADWEESDSTKPSYVRNRPAAADMQADWAESDTGSPSYVRNRPSAFDRQADWAETDSSKPSYVRNKPAAGATIAEVERAVAVAVAGKQDALGGAALAAVSSGITADKVRYFERIAAFALGGGSAGYPFVALAPEVSASGWSFLPSFAAPGETGWAFAVPVRDGGRWLPMPWEATLDPEGFWDGVESGDSADADVSVSFPRMLGELDGAGISDFVAASGDLPASVLLAYRSSTYPAQVVSREIGGETLWYCVAPRQGQTPLFSDAFRSLAEIEAAADAGLSVACWAAPADSEDSLEPDFSGVARVAWTVSARGTAEDVLTVPVFSCSAFVPGARPVRVVPGTLPEGVSGVQRDMFLVLDCEGLASVPAVAWDSAFDVFDGDVAPVAGEANIYRLTEYAEGRFSVRRAGAVQADWSESDSTDPAFVRNRPDVVTKGFLLDGGKVKAGLLPSFVDDVLEYSDDGSFPAEGESGKIYVDTSTGRTYRWGGSAYFEIAAHMDVDDSVDYDTGMPSMNPVANAAVAAELAKRREKTDLAVYDSGSWLYYPSLPGVVATSDPRRTVTGEDQTEVWALDYDNDGYPGTIYDLTSPADATDLLFSGSDHPFTVRAVFSAGATSDRLAKLSDIAQADWDESSSGDPSFVKNKPQIPDVTGKADKVSGATAGNLAAFNAQGNLVDSGAKPSDFATPSDLPYALVTPGEWEFSGTGIPSDLTAEWDSIQNGWVPKSNGSDYGAPTGTQDAATLSWDGNNNSSGYPLTATRAYALADRAVNTVSGATTLTLPGKIDGKSRDFYLKMTVTGSQNVSFSPSAGITYTGFGNPAKTYSAGTYLLRFTETAENEFCVTDMLAEYADASALSYALVSKTPVSGTVTLSDRAVNLVSPTVTALPPVWEWSDGLDHGQPKYGVFYDGGYQEYAWGFQGEGDTLSETDSLGHYLGYAYYGSDATELSFYDFSTDETIVASLVTPYETDVSSLSLPLAVAGKSRDFMVRLAMPEHAAMFSWPSGVDFETEDGQMPDVSEPGVYLLAFTETGAGRFALLCRKVQEVS